MARKTEIEIAGVTSPLGGMPKVSETSSSKTIEPNKLYVWDAPVASLAITLGAVPDGDSDLMNYYMFRFVSGSTPTVLSPISGVTGIDPDDIEADKIYEVNILDGFGIMKEVGDYVGS